MTGTAAETELLRTTPFPGRPGAAPFAGMDRVIQRTWLQINRGWIAFALLATVCTIALLSASRNVPRGLNINEGRIVVSTVKQGQFDDSIPALAAGARARDTPADATVVGVVEDLHMRSIHAEITPTIFYAGDDVKVFYSFILRLKPGAQEATLAAIDRAWYFLQSGLNNFPYRVDLSPFPFAAAGLLALLVVWGTVLSHACRVAGLDAVVALRYE